MSVHDSPWSQVVRDRWFFGFLAAGTVAVAWLYAAYAYILLFAATTVVVSWPLYERVLKRCANRTAIAAVLTTAILALVIFVPITLLIVVALREALAIGEIARDWVDSGGYEIWAKNLSDAVLSNDLTVWLGDFLPADTDLLSAVVATLQTALITLGTTLTSAVPGFLASVATGFVGGIIFLFAVVTFYMEGPRVLRFLANLSPMDDIYERRLFEVFRELANNLVVGSLATAAVQGAVATLGYAIAGVDRVVFVGLMTGIFSFFPVVGTAVVWIPVALYTGATQGVEWGVFVAVWSVAFTGTVDNFLKPMFLRGSSNIHPLLIFLAVFGGLGRMGLPGVLIGPVIVAGFLALYTIYEQHFVGTPEDREAATE